MASALVVVRRELDAGMKSRGRMKVSLAGTACQSNADSPLSETAVGQSGLRRICLKENQLDCAGILPKCKEQTRVRSGNNWNAENSRQIWRFGLLLMTFEK